MTCHYVTYIISENSKCDRAIILYRCLPSLRFYLFARCDVLIITSHPQRYFFTSFDHDNHIILLFNPRYFEVRYGVVVSDNDSTDDHRASTTRERVVQGSHERPKTINVYTNYIIFNYYYSNNIMPYMYCNRMPITG
jgi:hypothetical protein